MRVKEITKIKNEVKLKHWAEMVSQRNESGLSISQWLLGGYVRR